MVLIRFPDTDSERRALGYLAGRFSFKTWQNGQTLVPEAALPSLAVEHISFTVEGPATYEAAALGASQKFVSFLYARSNETGDIPLSKVREKRGI